MNLIDIYFFNQKSWLVSGVKALELRDENKKTFFLSLPSPCLSSFDLSLRNKPANKATESIDQGKICILDKNSTARNDETKKI